MQWEWGANCQAVEGPARGPGPPELPELAALSGAGRVACRPRTAPVSTTGVLCRAYKEAKVSSSTDDSDRDSTPLAVSPADKWRLLAGLVDVSHPGRVASHACAGGDQKTTTNW
jgi:hypothetical protein